MNRNFYKMRIFVESLIGFIDLLLPPVKDNEEAAGYFSKTIGQKSYTLE